mmetsp:Transcript_119476/g.283617  ORF Transcript_119476/g.283617 Transcript_119476/m.283617 type:complete len:315 (-) Transcript_119476:302-1246(-)
MCGTKSARVAMEPKSEESPPSRNTSQPCFSNSCARSKSQSKLSEARWLGNFEEVPEYQRRPYILRYYRLEAPQLRHFWRPHNELGNMWTHVLAAAFTIFRFVYWWRGSAPVGPGALQLYTAGVASFFLASLLTFTISVIYHWRHCGKEHEVKCWLCLDISSCGLLLLVGFLAGVPMGFHCYPDLQKTYLMQAASVAFATLGAFSTESKATRGERSTPTLIVGGISALWPAVHWLFICEPGRQAAGAWIGLVMVSGCLATLCYVKGIPECYHPGRFDLVCNSHQWWHVLIYLAVAAYTEALVTVLALTSSPSFCQ